MRNRIAEAIVSVGLWIARLGDALYQVEDPMFTAMRECSKLGNHSWVDCPQRAAYAGTGAYQPSLFDCQDEQNTYEVTIR